LVAQAIEVEELTPDPRTIARDEAKDYVKYTLYIELPPGIDRLDLVLPPLPEDRAVVDDDDVYGLQRRGDTTRRALGHISDPTASTALSADKRRAPEVPRRRIQHAQVAALVDKLNAQDRQLIWHLGNTSMKAAALSLSYTRGTVHKHTVKALEALVELLYKHSARPAPRR